MQWIWICVVLVIVGTGAWAFFVWQTIQNSIAISRPLIEKAVPYEQHSQNASIHILVAGDSIGVGVGAADNKDSIAGRLGKEFPDAKITNIAHSGDKIVDLETKLSEHSLTDYDLVFISIGGNDITHGTSFSVIRSSLERTLKRAEVLGKKVVVLTAGNVGVCPAFLWPFSEYITWRTREVRNIFTEEISKHQNTSYLDLFNERKDEPFNRDIPRYYAPDLFHPSGDGYGLWFEKLRPLL